MILKRRLSNAVYCASHQECCGMPSWSPGLGHGRERGGLDRSEARFELRWDGLELQCVASSCSAGQGSASMHARGSGCGRTTCCAQAFWRLRALALDIVLVVDPSLRAPMGAHSPSTPGLSTHGARILEFALRCKHTSLERLVVIRVPLGLPVIWSRIANATAAARAGEASLRH